MIFLRLCLGFVICISMLSSCSSSTSTTDTNSNANDSSMSSSSLNAILTNGTWYVSVYQEKTEDKSSKFDGFSFQFNADGSLTINDAKAGSSEIGTWAYTPAVTYYGSTSKAAMTISASNSNPQKLLSGKWNFISAKATSIEVTSPEVAEQLRLVFSKR